MNAKLVKHITCPALGLSILKGSQFTIITQGKAYATCTGLPVSSVWNDEFEIISCCCEPTN